MSSIFGLNTTYTKGTVQISDLPRYIREHGFDDFSPEGISSFLTFRYPISSLAMFDGFNRIPFGYDNNFNCFWYPRFKESKMKFEDAMKHIKNLLKTEIYRLGKDEEIAIPLSGGVDSSLIVALTREVFPEKTIRTYTATFSGASESEFANQVSRKFSTKHFEYNISLESVFCSGILSKLMAFKGEPLHPNEFALAIMEEWAKKDGCTIALCGEGGDDLFGGYSHNLRMHYNHSGLSDFWEFFLGQYRYISNEERMKIINDRYLVDDRYLLEKAMPREEIPKDKDNRMFYFIQKIHTPGLITRGANAMRYAGLKTGFPYICLALVNFVNSLPFEYKLRWKKGFAPENVENILYKDLADNYSTPKFILKSIAEDYFDEDFVHRSKVAFPVPFENWFKHVREWNLDPEVFISQNISSFTSWEKFMLINLDLFIKEFRKYQK